MKLSALAFLLLCLNRLWRTPCSAAEIPQGTPGPTLETPNLGDNKTADEASSNETCSYYDLVKHLNLTEEKEKFTLVRPVKDHKSVTNVTLDVSIYAILDVDEIGQKLITSLWIWTVWMNYFIKWDPSQFCGINTVTVPAGAVWKPDIIIQDMIDKDRDKCVPSPTLTVVSNGYMSLRSDLLVVSTCQIRPYKFPFDHQTCELNFRSISYLANEIHLVPMGNSTLITKWSQETLKTEYEWIFSDLAVKENNTFLQDVVTYSIHMVRRSRLYVVNYILPLLFLFLLDFASFLMSDSGNKLSFKITVLLTVTVMQLMFHKILPASSEYIPIIAIFCVGIFSMMLLSLLESIVVLYLLNKEEKQDQGDPCRRLKDALRLSYKDVPDGSTVEMTQLSDKVQAALNELIQDKPKEAEPGYWTKKVPIINRVFFIVYIITATLFLGIIFHLWLH